MLSAGRFNSLILCSSFAVDTVQTSRTVIPDLLSYADVESSVDARILSSNTAKAHQTQKPPAAHTNLHRAPLPDLKRLKATKDTLYSFSYEADGRVLKLVVSRL